MKTTLFKRLMLF